MRAQNQSILPAVPSTADEITRMRTFRAEMQSEIEALDRVIESRERIAKSQQRSEPAPEATSTATPAEQDIEAQRKRIEGEAYGSDRACHCVQGRGEVGSTIDKRASVRPSGRHVPGSHASADGDAIADSGAAA